MKNLDISVKIFLIITSLFAGIYLLAFFGRSNLPEIEVLDPSDPLLKDAKNKAAETIAVFDSLQPLFPNNTFVRFKFVNAKNEEEHVWGRVMEKNKAALKITDINKKTERDNPAYPKFYDLSLEQVEDWLVEVGNDSVKGGFTTQVILLRKLQDQPEKRDETLAQLGLFLDPLE
jgi:Uncharacterized protein conserved in bacteria (DUF2314)